MLRRVLWILTLLLVPALAQAQLSASLSWTDNSNNEQGFRVERKTGQAGTYAIVVSVAADETTAVDQGPLTEGTEYCWRVVAFNAGGEAASNEVCKTTPILPPNAPTDLNVQVVTLPEFTPQGIRPDPPELAPQPSEFPLPPGA